MSELFKKTVVFNSANGNAAIAPPSNGIRFSGSLIADLENDHRLIIESYLAAVDAFESGESTQIKKHLEKLKQLLTGHLLKENRKLYPYLDNYYQGEQEKSRLVNQFKDELRSFGNLVFSLLRKYTLLPAAFDSVFKKELDAVGEALEARVEAEETRLFPLYLPVEKPVAVD